VIPERCPALTEHFDVPTLLVWQPMLVPALQFDLCTTSIAQD